MHNLHVPVVRAARQFTMMLLVAFALVLTAPTDAQAGPTDAAAQLAGKSVSISYNINGWKKERANCISADAAGIYYTVTGNWDSYEKKWTDHKGRTRFIPWNSISSVTVL